MNIKLDWSTEFLAICAYEEQLLPTHFSVTMQLTTKTDDARHQNIAFERAKLMVSEIFSNGVFIGQENRWVKTLSEFYPEKVVLLPEDPYDQVIGIALFCKINAIMEGKIVVDSIKTNSNIIDPLWYHHAAGNSLGVFGPGTRPRNKKVNASTWWNRSDIMTFDTCTKLDTPDWGEFGLAWEDDQNSELFATIIASGTSPDAKPKTKKKTAKNAKGAVIDMKKPGSFSAEIIDGGKNTDGD